MRVSESKAMPLGGLTVSLIVVDALLRRLILPLVLLSGENNIAHIILTPKNGYPEMGSIVEP